MTEQALYEKLQATFRQLLDEQGWMDKTVEIHCKTLTPVEAIGTTKRLDFPILNGAEVMMQASVDGAIGQAFTSTPASYSGTLYEVAELEILQNAYNRSIFLATLNALMRKLSRCDCTIHCKNNGPEECAEKILEQMKQLHPNAKIALIGYQPAMLEQLSKEFELRVLDLNPANVGDVRYGVLVQDGIRDYEDTVAWADVILCTSSTVGNGSIVKYMEIDKPVYFFGTTGAATAEIFGLKRMCFAD
jgi:uncharacterized protein (DUF4213/DUF364 family)